MQTADLDEFEELIGRLCASYEVPVTKSRKDAHWADCRKMSIAQYRRCIEFVTSDAGPDKLPSTKILWRIHRQLTNPGGARAAQPERRNEPDHLEYFANRLLLQHVASRGGLGDELKPMLAAKRKLIDEFLGYVREGDELATPAEFIRGFLSVMRRLSPATPECAKRFRDAMAAPGMDQPFHPAMARELNPQPETA